MPQTNFELRKPLNGQKYRWIRHWKAIAAYDSTPNDPRFYLLVHADVCWDDENIHPVFAILMQHSTTIGHDVRLRKPAHIHPDDAVHIAKQFAAFVELFNGQDPPPESAD